MDDLRVGIAGYGLAGRFFHAPLVATTPGFALTHVVTRSPDRAASARAEHPGVSVVDSVQALWGSIDLLVVATPNSSHAELAAAAIDHQVAVVVDKPLAVDGWSAARLGARAAESAVALSVFHNRRWDADLLTVQRLISDGTLGRVLRCESRFERWRPQAPDSLWRAQAAQDGGGLLLDLGTHLVDQAIVLFGPVTSVYAEVAVRRAGHHGEDDAFLALTHGGGVVSHLWVSAMSAAPGPRFRVLGDHAAYVVDGLDGQEAALRAGRRPDGPAAWGVEPERAWGRLLRGDTAEAEPVPSERGDWPAFYRQMEAAVRGTGSVPVDPWDAVRVLAVLEAARRSAESGEVVPVPELPLF